MEISQKRKDEKDLKGKERTLLIQVAGVRWHLSRARTSS